MELSKVSLIYFSNNHKFVNNAQLNINSPWSGTLSTHQQNWIRHLRNCLQGQGQAYQRHSSHQKDQTWPWGLGHPLHGCSIDLSAQKTQAPEHCQYEGGRIGRKQVAAGVRLCGLWSEEVHGGNLPSGGAGKEHHLSATFVTLVLSRQSHRSPWSQASEHFGLKRYPQYQTRWLRAGSCLRLSS